VQRYRGLVSVENYPDATEILATADDGALSIGETRTSSRPKRTHPDPQP